MWTDLDLDIVESEEEARLYDAQVRHEIQWKEQHVHLDGADIRPAEAHRQASPQLDLNASSNKPFQSSTTTVSKIQNTPHARPTGHSTLPSVPTPNEASTPLPLPLPLPRASTSRLRHATLQTPDAIPSPIDSPNTTGPSKSALEPGTPVPLGNAAFAALKGKKDYRTLTKHFEAFEKTVAKREEANTSKSSTLSRTKSASSRGLPALGGRVFSGLRFCIPPELGQVTKHKQRWDIVSPTTYERAKRGQISKLGGQVTLQPDTAITHVIYDKTSASILARDLGLQTLSDLPSATICIRWDWVVNCKLAGKLLNVAMYLSFPKTAFTRTVSTDTAPFKVPSRIMDITDRLHGKSISISKKREHTASDSDTESPRKPRRAPLARGSIGLSRSTLAINPLLKGQPSIATSHAIPSGPGWQIAPKEGQDALDEMISGVMNGTVHDEDQVVDDDLSGNPDSRGDYFRCGQKHEGMGNHGPNEWLAKKFEDLHDLYQGVQGKNPFAIRQYQQAASICRRTLVPITSGKEALGIKGVGQSIADRASLAIVPGPDLALKCQIDEFINGGLGRQYYEDNEQSRTIAMFKDIYGVGRTFANELYRRGARQMADLQTKDFGLTPGQMVNMSRSRLTTDWCRVVRGSQRAYTPGRMPTIVRDHSCRSSGYRSQDLDRNNGII